MNLWKIINPKRLRDYPRLILFASWGVIIVNILLHQGWIGGLTGILIGGDFISNYSGGILYHNDIENLYNPAVQQESQSTLISPSQTTGYAPFISPPYVALAMSWIRSIPLAYAFIGWEILNLVCVVVSVYLLTEFIIPRWLLKSGLSPVQMSIIIFSTFAFIDGFISGQSHGITLLLCTGIILAMMRQQWILAGILGSLLIYKPQFVIGFLICWLVWKSVRAILSFGIFTLMWQIPVVLAYGISPYLEYLKLSNSLLYLPYAKESFPISVMATPYALMATLFPAGFAKVIQILFLLVGIAMVIFLSFVAYQSQTIPIYQRYFSISLALLFPLIIAPHTLIYDLLILVPAIILLTNYSEIRPAIFKLTLIYYISLLFLPLIGYAVKLALPALIPLSLLILLIIVYFRTNTIFERS